MKNAILMAAIGISLVCFGSRTSAQGNAMATLKDGQGNVVGTATIQASPGGGLQLNFNITKLPPGDHGVHIHNVPKCDGPDFATAGPHFNPTNKKHGTLNPEGPHGGDIAANLHVEADGKVARTLTDPRLTLGPATDPNSIWADGGKAIVIHATADDMKTDPSGNSGARIACGVIEKAK